MLTRVSYKYEQSRFIDSVVWPLLLKLLPLTLGLGTLVQRRPLFILRKHLVLRKLHRVTLRRFQFTLWWVHFFLLLCYSHYNTTDRVRRVFKNTWAWWCWQHLLGVCHFKIDFFPRFSDLIAVTLNDDLGFSGLKSVVVISLSLAVWP